MTNNNIDEFINNFLKDGISVLYMDVLYPTIYKKYILKNNVLSEAYLDITNEFFSIINEQKLEQTFRDAIVGSAKNGAFTGALFNRPSQLLTLLEENMPLKEGCCAFMHNTSYPLLQDELSLYLSDSTDFFKHLKNAGELRQELLKLFEQFEHQKKYRAALIAKQSANTLGILFESWIAQWQQNGYSKTLNDKIIAHYHHLHPLTILLQKSAQLGSIYPMNSPLFLSIEKSELHRYFPALFNQQGQYLFDLNETIQQKNLSALTGVEYALYHHLPDMAFELHQSGALLSADNYRILLCQLIDKEALTSIQLVDQLDSTMVELSKKSALRKKISILFEGWLTKLDDKQRYPLFDHIIENKQLELAFLLLKESAFDINMQSHSSKKSLLHTAVEENNKALIAKLTMQHTVDYNLLDQSNIHILDKSNDLEILAKLFIGILKQRNIPSCQDLIKQIKRAWKAYNKGTNKTALSTLIASLKDQLLHDRGEHV